MRVKGSERRPFIFIFRLNIALCDLYIRQMKLSLKLRNGNKKFQTTMLKALVELD